MVAGGYVYIYVNEPGLSNIFVWCVSFLAGWLADLCTEEKKLRKKSIHMLYQSRTTLYYMDGHPFLLWYLERVIFLSLCTVMYSCLKVHTSKNYNSTF